LASLDMILPLINRSLHRSQQGWPIQGVRTPELEGAGIFQSSLLGYDHDESAIIQTTPPRPSKHLQKLIGSQKKKTIVHSIFPIGYQDGSHGKINPGSETCRGHHDLQLARLGQRFDHPGPFQVIQSAMVVGNPFAEQCAQFLSHNSLLIRRKLQCIDLGQLSRKLPGKFFGRLSSRSKQQKRT
jgi:hypothetical protein